MNKRVFTIIIALLLAAFVPKAYGQEAGDSAGNPIEISEVSHLQDITKGLDKYYKLTKDINLGGNDWTPIYGEFTGTLDGNGHVISGLNVSATGNAGLFATINKDGIVKNLGVIGSVTSTNDIAGGIAGENNGTIQNCYTSVAVTANSNKDAGGIAGYNYGTIQNCYTTGAINGKNAGGIAGFNGGKDVNLIIQYCYATGAINGTNAGGIAGYIGYGNVQNCIALNASITGTTSVGRIIGSDGDGALTNNHAAPYIPGAWVDGDKVADGISGANLPSTFGTDGAGAGAFVGWTATNWDFTTESANLPQVNTDGGASISGQTASKPRADYLEVPTITTKEELATINLSGSYKLGNDITLEGNWTPLGTFTGTLDGCGYTISGLKVSVGVNAGLFASIGVGGTVKNLGVTSGSVTATSTNAGGYAGGIAGYSEGTIQNCYTSVAVTASSDADGAGGIVGNNDGTIKNCYTTGAVTNEAGYAGGIAGKNTKDIQYCYATGIIKGSKAGGITGENSLNTRHCIALNGSITGTTSVGRIAGGTSTSVFATNHAALSIPGAWADKDGTKKNGADLTEDTFTGKGANAGAFTGWIADNWDFTTTPNLPILMGFKTANQPVKDVARAPFLEVPVTTITTQAELAAIKDNLAGSYKLGNDITLTGDWAPLGEFTGTLDGCGFTISKLKVSVNDNAGLFETIGTGGTVKNLGVTDGSVTSASASAGSIASENRGTIQNCYTSVTVTVSDMNNAGGIASKNTGTIQNCYTTGAVTSEKGYAGGIAGENSDDANTGTIQNCYATGVIKGYQAGGISGKMSDKGQILNCIALNDSIKNHTDGSSSARILGYNNGGTLTNNYAALSIPGVWEADDKGAGTENGADLTEDNFTGKGVNAGAFTGWTAVNWDFSSTPDLPFLKGFKTDQPVKDKKRAPFLVVPVTTIKTQAELAAIKDNLAGSYKLGGNITLTGNWTPLGDDTNKFTGTLDGCGFTISGLNVSMTETTSTYAGLFGTIDTDGTVKNLGVTGSITVTTTGDYAYAYAGGIAGESAGKITNCYTNVTVSATSKSFIYAGGIVGYMSAKTAAISNCFATGNCTATGTGTSTAIAGGILGGNNGKGAISYCFATGAVEAKGATSFKYAGGIAGQSGTTMTGCIALNKGITGASDKTNRIAGNHIPSTITDCYASPAIPGTWSETGADKKDGADLTNANFINSNDAFTGWVPNDWTLGENWQFEDKDFANLPTLLTNGLDEDIALKGQPTIKRADYLGLVLIDKAVTYDANLHKDKNLVIAPTGNLTVSAASAQVSSLEIQPGGQVTTTAALGVTKAISTSRTLENQWSTFGAPVAMTFKAIETAYKLQGYESSEAAEQQWTRFNLPSSAVSLTAASPYLLAIDEGSETVSFSSDKGTPIPVSATAESGTTLSNGIFLFRTNPSLSNQTVTNAYILSDDGTRFELQDTAYTLKPFECYVIANAATTKAVQSLRVANGIPTGNDPITLPSDAFRLWGADGQLHLEASQPTDVQIYTLTGTLAHSFRLDGSRTLTLPRGIYLVRSNNITYKVSL